MVNSFLASTLHCYHRPWRKQRYPRSKISSTNTCNFNSNKWLHCNMCVLYCNAYAWKNTKMQFTAIMQNPSCKQFGPWGEKLIKAYFYYYNEAAHKKRAHNPLCILTCNLRMQVSGLNLNRLFLTSQEYFKLITFLLKHPDHQAHMKRKSELAGSYENLHHSQSFLQLVLFCYLNQVMQNWHMPGNVER